MSQSFSNNTDSLNTNTSYTAISVSNNFTVADDRSNILAWLSPLDPKLRHQDIQDRRVENIGEWLLQTEEFRSWNACSERGESDKGVLFCYGDPGVRKTYNNDEPRGREEMGKVLTNRNISPLVIDSLCDQAGGQNVSVACFYFDFAAQKEQSPTNTMGALLKQVVGGLEEIPVEISRAYQNQKEAIGGRGPRLPDIVKMLQATTSKERTLICIDVLLMNVCRSIDPNFLDR